MDVMEEINGLRSYDAQMTLHNNEHWASHLANVILARPSVPDAGARLPPEIIAVVAEIVAGDNDLHTLSKLNRVSRQTHLGTLPVLYETVKFDDERAVERSIRATHPKGFKYCKFLFVTEITLPLLRMYLRHQTYHLPEPSTDLTQIFPRLTMLALARIVDHIPRPAYGDDNFPLDVTLYRPMSIPELMRATTACIPSHLERGVSFFGTYYLRRTRGERRVKPSVFKDIVGLSLMRGAYLLPAEGQVGMSGWHATWAGLDYKLEIDDEAANAGVQDSVRFVLDHLAMQMKIPRPKDVTDENDRRLEVKCTPAVFGQLIESFHSVQPCLLDMRADLTLPVSADTMQRLVQSLGEAYAVHWQHRPDCENQIFAQIQAPAIDISALTVVDATSRPEEIASAIYRGELAFGNNADEDNDNGNALGEDRPNTGAGYTAVVAEDILANGEGADVIVWEANFPVAHVPFVPLPAGQMPRMRPADLEALAAQIQTRRRAPAADAWDVERDGPDQRIFAPMPEMFERMFGGRQALAAGQQGENAADEGGDTEGDWQTDSGAE